VITRLVLIAAPNSVDQSTLLVAIAFIVFGVEQISFFCKVSLVCAAGYEVEHSENSLEFPTLYAVLATCIY
jgi:hypothetical protein